MRYHLKISRGYQRDLERLKRKRHDLNRLLKTLTMLRHGESLPASYRPHRLRHASYAGFYECHLAFDWLLV
ncbi:type II toxin-antitoxin system RelE/ParE family toxin [Calothrix sp. 336/3]|uniref:type II toxin-antitoxin system RelE/ParE family toxin n=1 Tax=Calothrix sp. 336/3 TaxID=1337936 RepID=UPI0009E20727